jgi:hypothetical protein
LASIGFQKVHVVSVGFEIDRVVLPVQRIGADRVVIVTNTKETGVYRTMIDEVRRRLTLKTRLAIEEAPMNIFDMSALFGGVSRIVRRERELQNIVFINISVGTRLFGAVGYLAALMHGAIPYYAEVEKYRIRPEDFMDGKRRPLGISKGVREVHMLPRPQIDFPPMELVAALSILESAGGEAKEGEIIQKLERGGLISQIWENDKISKRARATFLRRFGDPLRRRGWVVNRGQRRSATICLTDEGREILEVFAPLLAVEADADREAN